MRRSKRRSHTGLELLVTVTLNDNQLRGYLRPILELPIVASATLVADVPAPDLPKLRTVVPPRLLVRVLGRAGAKLITCVVLAVRRRPDWIIGYNLVPHGITANLAGKASGARVLYVMIGGPVEWLGGGWSSDNQVVGRLPRPSPTLERALFHFVERSTAVVAMGTRAREELLARRIAPERVRVIPASVDERFRPHETSENKYGIVTVGSLIPTKRMHDVVAAAAELSRSRPGLRVAVLGDGPLRPALEAQAVSLGVGQVIDFLGFRSDVETFYASSSVFVLASAYEGLSNALADAMASGLPAVVSDVGEQRDLVVPGRNGYLFSPGDVPALVEAVGALLDDAELRRRLGAAAAADAQAHAGRETVAAAYEAMLREL